MKKTLITTLIFLALLASGCGSNTNDQQADDLQATQDFLDAVATGIVETIEAALQETAASTLTDQAVPTQADIPTATFTVPPLPTLAPTQPPVAFTPTPTPLPTPCYRAELVEETIPDGTVIIIGDGFTKTWVIKNTGVCAWSEDFRWKLVEGDDFRGATDLKISNEDVMPGETITISIEMGAPMIPGHYRSIYKLFTDEGAEVTPNGFWIDVEVVEK
jgi:hypothetical protein